VVNQLVGDLADKSPAARSRYEIEIG
jgi:hypothetical protein